MGLAQWVHVAITFGLNALDGFDFLAIGFAGPGIAADDPAGLESGSLKTDVSIVVQHGRVGRPIAARHLGGAPPIHRHLEQRGHQSARTSRMKATLSSQARRLAPTVASGVSPMKL